CIGKIPVLEFIEIMKPYNLQEIEMFVELTDITGNMDESKKEIINVDVIPDTTLPGITINSPEEEGIYENKRVLFDIIVDKTVDLFYVDNSNGRMKRLVRKDSKYYKLINLKEGLNDITFLAIDNSGNKANVSRIFYVDSKKPRVYSPKVLYKGFTNGTNLEILYSDDNVKKVSLFYTINGVEKIESRDDCLSGKKIKCDISLDLKDLEGEEINYFFRVEDIAGNFRDSKITKAIIDVTPPVITNPDSLYSVSYNRVYFDISFIEENFFDVSYFDPIEKYPRWRRLCSRLENGKCVKMQVFRPGDRTVLLRVNDRAGNYVEVEI
ncbi:hypothetical protein GOV12_03705, partial [Candidatus Pacearchaeota archaeon]|nr:hypothetical protein [Candidatus Pacearchaeota archaeon]